MCVTSLRATAITRMFNKKTVIAENTGHKSLKALHCYEHTSSEQQKVENKVVTEHSSSAGEETAKCEGQCANVCLSNSQSLQVLNTGFRRVKSTIADPTCSKKLSRQGLIVAVQAQYH